MKFGVREICDVVFKAKKSGTLGSHAYNVGQPVLYIDSAKASTIEGAATTVYAQGGKGNARLISWEGEKTLTFTVEDALLSDRSFAILSGADLIKKNSKESISIHRYEEKILDISYNNSNGFVESLYVKNMQNVNTSKPCFVIGIGLNGQMFTLPENIFVYVENEKRLSYITYKPAHQFPIEIQQYLEAGITSIPVIVDYYEEKTSASYNYTIDAGNFAGNWYVEAETSFRRQSDGKDLKTILTLPNVKIQSNFTFSMAATGDPSTFTFTMDALPGYTMNNKTKQVLCEMQVLDEEVEKVKNEVSIDSIVDNDWETLSLVTVDTEYYTGNQFRMRQIGPSMSGTAEPIRGTISVKNENQETKEFIFYIPMKEQSSEFSDGIRKHYYTIDFENCRVSGYDLSPIDDPLGRDNATEVLAYDDNTQLFVFNAGAELEEYTLDQNDTNPTWYVDTDSVIKFTSGLADTTDDHSHARVYIVK